MVPFSPIATSSNDSTESLDFPFLLCFLHAYVLILRRTDIMFFHIFSV